MSANIKKAIVAAVSALATVLAIAFGLSSCTAVRTISTSSECLRRGDTTVVITTKTVENYTAKKDW